MMMMMMMMMMTMTRHQAELRFDELLRSFQSKGIGKFCVVERTNGQLVGYCGIESFIYQENRTVELGYRVRLEVRVMHMKRAKLPLISPNKLVIQMC